MPTFGDFETVDEPIESREDRRHLTQVWQAVRISVKDGRLYAVKCYAPRHGRRPEEAPKEDLEEHRTLEFLEGVKQIKKASAEGQKYLTPIYEFGLTSSGDAAWYVTDFYGDVTPVLPRTLRSYITRGGKVDGEALRHTIHSVVLGCLALKRSRGCSHGNLKTTNVFRAGKPRPLRKTPLVLGDAFPVAPLQLAELDPQNKLEVGDLLKATMEAHDLRALGELILQMVEVRLITHVGDYDYPIIPSREWSGLGKEGERWRQLCNRLLDPSLSLERVNLESLEKELRPGLVSTHAPQIAGAAVLLCVLVGGGYFGWRYYESSQAERRTRIYGEDMEGARTALAASDSEPTKILDAVKLADDALRRLPADPNAGQLKTDAEAKRDGLFHRAFSAGTNDLAAGKFDESVAQLKIAAVLKPDDSDARRWRDEAQARVAAIALAAQKESDYQAAMTNGRGFFSHADYSRALAEAGKALALKPDDTDATKLRDDAQAKLSEIAAVNQQEADYQTAMKAGRGSFRSGDFNDALAQARKALTFKANDAEAIKLRDDAQSQLAAVNQANQNETAYQAAMKSGRGSFTSGDFNDALAQARKALTFKANDAEAMKLRDDAQTQLAAINQTKQNETAYQAAIKAGHDSFTSGDYIGALAQARKALTFKAGDADAAKLRDDAQAQLAAVNQKDSDYLAAMKNGKQLLTLADTDASKLQPALDQFQVALNSKPSDTEATTHIKEVQGRIDKAFTLAFEAGSKEASAGNKDEANRQLDRMKALKPGDAQVGGLALVIANIAVPHPSVKRAPTTNFSGVFGQSIPDFDFVWVDGIGPGGAYVAVNELSWDQYQVLGGSEKPLNASFAHRPASMEFAKAQALVASLNASPAGKKVKFRLPSLEEYKTLSGVTDFSAISEFVTADKSPGENFKRPADIQPREIVSVPTTNKIGLRNVIGNVREWTTDGRPFGNSYAWGQSGLHGLTDEPRPSEQIGLRLIGEPSN